MASMNTRLNIEKLDGNIVQNHGGSKQVGFKQLGPGFETGVHGVHDEKCVWFEVKLHGAQRDRKAEIFQVSNDDTVVAQRRLKDKQPKEKTNTDYLVKEQKKEYRTGWKIKTGNVLDSYNQRSTQQCTKSGVTKHLGASGLSKVLWAEDTTMSIYLVNKVVLYRNMGFNESGEYKKTFIGSRIGTGSMQVLQGVEFEVEPQDDHTFEVEPNGNVAHELIKYREDSNEAAFAVAEAEKIYAHESLTFNNTVACEVISKWKVGLKDNMDARSDVYVLSNSCKKCSDDNDVYYWEYTPGSMGPILPPGLHFQWTWSRSLRSQHEIDELNEIVSLLSNLHLSNSHDTWECYLNHSHGFSENLKRCLALVGKFDNINVLSLLEAINLLDKVSLPPPLSALFDAVVQATLWFLWRYRNEFAFSLKILNLDLLFNDIKLFSFN
ncbi:hypothetical protein Tco_0412801 [Tanacetum coccineum]